MKYWWELVKVILNIECANKLLSCFACQYLKKDTLISADWKCKSLKKCVEIERTEKIYDEI
jgi:hypothetical protein